jgi:hypothetical protein
METDPAIFQSWLAQAGGKWWFSSDSIPNGAGHWLNEYTHYVQIDRTDHPKALEARSKFSELTGQDLLALMAYRDSLNNGQE